ncbi:MAG: VCBS repeat-containing protein, partial [Pirellulaceae bacterium]|nr:VCBS repeat-containing protein [Pirellulaceae bacterium]
MLRSLMFSLVLSTTVIIVSSTDAGGEEWRKTVVSSGASCATAGGGDFTGDGKVDVIANVGGRTVLFVAPSWREIELDRDLGFIHSEVMDVDNDGDLDAF